MDKDTALGLVTKGQKGVTFRNVTVSYINDDPNTNPNHPDNPDSPNHPRVPGRLPGYTNPIIGDPGKYQIARWQTINMDALEDAIDQIIEHYLRDKDWYARVRCREALWNMYRRLEWWVKQQKDPQKSQYQRVLLMIQHCIHEITDPEETDKHLVFEELFNDQNYSSQIVHSSSWKWVDIFKYLGIENKKGDGVLLVDNVPGTHTVSLVGFTLPHPGELTFQYGADFAQGDSLELYINGQKVWGTTTSVTTAGGNNISIPLEAGTYDIEWRYNATNNPKHQYAWIDVIRLYEDRPKFVTQFVDGNLDEGLTYSDGWFVDLDRLKTTVTGSGQETVTRTEILRGKGYVQFQFAANLSPGAEFYLLVNGKKVWSYAEAGKEGYNLRDVRIELEEGLNTLQWVVRNESGTSTVIIDKITVSEILPKDPDNFGLKHGIEVPYCPAPYYHHFNADYFNHFDNFTRERVLFSMKDLPKLGDLHGLFRYVSVSDEQEWELVHSVGDDESQGNENILKLDLSKLKHGNSSKITFNWRYKRMGYIRFKYLASTDKGNNLYFYIDGILVGGGWSQEAGWKEVTFNVSPGQTHKFDWIVRKLSEKEWGHNAIYIKDIELIETIRSWDVPAPPDYDREDKDAFKDTKYEWTVFSDKSVVRARNFGAVTEENKVRDLVMELCGECDGWFSFGYRLGTDQPDPQQETDLFFDDDYESPTLYGEANRGSTAQSYIDPNWSLDGEKAETREGGAVVRYDLYAAKNTKLRLEGSTEVICSEREIDHYQEVFVGSGDGLPWSMSGVNVWARNGGQLIMNDPIVQGVGDATTTVTLEYDGWFVFSYDHDFRPSESLQVLVDGVLVHESRYRESESNVIIPLSSGTHQITFRVNDTETEQPLRDGLTKYYYYGEHTDGKTYTFETNLGSQFSVTRNWDVKNDRARATQNGQTISYDIVLNPGAKFKLTEKLRVVDAKYTPTVLSGGRLIFEEDFNVKDVYDPRISMTSNWQWEDIWKRYHPSGDGGDGVYKVEGKNGSVNKITLHAPYLSRPGYLTFEYGGMFSEYEGLTVYVDGEPVWFGNQSSTGPGGTDIAIPLPPGSHVIEWVYQDLDSVEIRDGEYSDTTNTDLSSSEANREQCYPSGSKTHRIVYKYSDSGLPSATTKSKMFWSGGSFVGNYHGTYTDGVAVRRRVITPSFEGYEYREKLTVYAGKVYIPRVKSYKNADDHFSAIYDGYVALTAFDVRPPSYSYYIIPFSVSGSGKQRVDIKFDYVAFQRILNDGFGHKNTISNKPRTIFRVRWRKVGGSWNTIHTDTYNRGNYLQPVDNVTNWSGAYKFRKTLYLEPGKYELMLQLIDNVEDYDYAFVNYRTYPYYVAVKFGSGIVHVHQKDVAFDDTSVTVRLIDRKTGQVIVSRVYKPDSDGVSVFDIYFEIPPNADYEIVYILNKGKGYIGGLHGKGGEFILSEGQFIERWEAYCRDKNGNYYPADGTPYSKSPTKIGGIPPKVVIPPDSWCWVDVIRIYESDDPGCDANAFVRVNVSGTDGTNFTSLYGSSDSQINVEIQNNTDSVQRYTITMTFLKGCPGSFADLFDGMAVLEDVLPPRESYARVWGISFYERIPVYMGGCDDSGIVLKIYNDKGNVIYEDRFINQGEYYFSYTLPGEGRYRVELITIQNGQISSVTGKDYRTILRVTDFKVEEIWKSIPSPFCSRLEFYIDGQLKDVFTTPGYGERKYKVSAGCHEYKWRFISCESENNYDYADVDWVHLTNWICDKVLITPYCEPGGGDKCIEALIKCLLSIWKQRPRACVIGKKIWLFT